jgi:maltooligosyltrehalose trehalohydrolase
MNEIGAVYADGYCEFSVWAPEKDRMFLHLQTPDNRVFEMEKNQEGYFGVTVKDIGVGVRYRYATDGSETYPDPASHFQPDGVHGASMIVDHTSYKWSDSEWAGLPLKELIFYEVHVGTFTQEGTFEAMISRLDYLQDVGVNAIQMMPVAQFPGTRNWGYDGVFPFAVQNSYGGPQKLKELVDAAHRRGIAVFLDVVFNHIGPEGNYLGQFGPYFTDTYRMPWGDAINFDGEWSDGVREYFASCVLHWCENYHLDGLRVDAVHTMFDNGAVHFWEMANKKLDEIRQSLGRSFYLIAESDLNSPKVIQPVASGGWGFNAQWLDDFHHATYVLLDEKGKDRYEDFGQMEQLAKAYTDGFVHSGEFVKFRKRRFGASSAGISGEHFVVFNQNHDQVGNRVGGERLSMLVNFERQKLAAAAAMLSPYLPFIFMGEEFGADTPFFYFVSHSEEALIKKVVEGRKKEFENYQWETEPLNPQEEETFERSKLDWTQPRSGKYQVMLNWHKKLISLRHSCSVLHNFNKNDIRTVLFGEKGLALHRKSEDQKSELLCIFNFGSERASFTFPSHETNWSRVLDSRDTEWLEEDSSLISNTPEKVTGGEVIYLADLSVILYESINSKGEEID